MIRCVIIEDQPPAQRILRKYIGELGDMQLNGVFSDGLEAINFLKNSRVDLIFLDIHLPKISGIELIRILDPKPYIILTTAFSDYALESYDYDVVDYLLKPFSFERFIRAVSKVPSTIQMESLPGEKREVRTELYIKSGYEYIRVNAGTILYIKSDTDYTEIVTVERKYLSNEPLRYWSEILDPAKFSRSHKSFIINTSKIYKIIGNRVTLTDKTQIPIGRAYKEAFMKILLG